MRCPVVTWRMVPKRVLSVVRCCHRLCCHQPTRLLRDVRYAVSGADIASGGVEGQQRPSLAGSKPYLVTRPLCDVRNCDTVCCYIGLRAYYAKPGTYIAFVFVPTAYAVAMRSPVQAYIMLPYIRGTGLAYAATPLLCDVRGGAAGSVCSHAMSGTDVAYAPMRCRAMSGTEVAYAAMRYPGLTSSMPLRDIWHLIAARHNNEREKYNEITPKKTQSPCHLYRECVSRLTAISLQFVPRLWLLVFVSGLVLTLGMCLLRVCGTSMRRLVMSSRSVVLCQVGDLLLEAAALYEKRRAYVLQAEALVLFPLLSYAVLTYSIARRCPLGDVGHQSRTEEGIRYGTETGHEGYQVRLARPVLRQVTWGTQTGHASYSDKSRGAVRQVTWGTETGHVGH
eukprot:3270911-Rhodomonas_salina.2